MRGLLNAKGLRKARKRAKKLLKLTLKAIDEKRRKRLPLFDTARGR